MISVMKFHVGAVTGRRFGDIIIDDVNSRRDPATSGAFPDRSCVGKPSWAGVHEQLRAGRS
jgi:hypothetical protein